MSEGTGIFNNYPDGLCRWALYCMYSSECLMGELNRCAYQENRGICFVYFLAKEIKNKMPIIYSKWKEIVEKQEEAGSRHGINSIIVYGLAKIYELRNFVIIPGLDKKDIERINKMEFGEIFSDLEPLLDYNLESLLAGINEENQLAVFKLFEMFYFGTKQPALL